MQQPKNKIIQVEFNTVASSFGAITTHLPAMSRYRQLIAKVSACTFFITIFNGVDVFRIAAGATLLFCFN